MDLLFRICVAAGLAVFGIGACGRNASECTCHPDVAGDRRVIACGETACVGGALLTCTDTDQTVDRGGCTPGAPPSASSAPPTSPPVDVDAGVPSSPDPRCDDLRTFCETLCTSPTTVAADCLTTANSGDLEACGAWAATNGITCRP